MNIWAWLRNGLIFAGIAAGGVLAVVQVVGAAGGQDADEGEEEVVAQPVVLNTARPPELGKTPLSRPVSLESGFGRSELTGMPVSKVPENPLDEIPIDRRWDVNLALKPPRPPSDLPPARATDEVVQIDEPEEASARESFRFQNLPPEARSIADNALVSLKEGTATLKKGMSQFRRPGQEGKEGQQMIREAAELLRDARDKLSSALELAPQDPELLRLMQEAKANLYICIKHGIY